MEPMEYFVQMEEGFSKPLGNADKIFFRCKVHIYRFYFVTSGAAIIVSIILIYFMPDYVRLRAVVTGFTISKIPQVEALVLTGQECDLKWYVYLIKGLILVIAPSIKN